MSVILTIGRQANNDIVLEENFISSYHAQLVRDENGHWFIHDLNSTNGTFVNGVQITTPTEIKNTDVIFLGGRVLEWKSIFDKYNAAVPFKKAYKSKLVHYALGLAAAVFIFLVFFLVNEFLFKPKGKSDGSSGSKRDSLGAKDSVTKKNTEDNGAKKTGNITYDLSCVTLSDNDNVNKVANKLEDVKNNYINTSGITVSLQEEIDFGNENHQSLLKGYSVLDNADSRHVEDILKMLVPKIPEARGFDYKIFLLDSKEINSWTSGGRIYFTNAMLLFTKNDDEIAAIIGHEIYHNELMHINNMLKAQKFAQQKFGDKNGSVISTINKILSSPFAKKDEAYCDLKGTDLIIAAGFAACNVINLWGRMAGAEGTYNPADNFMRGHPYAETRVTCIRNHLKVNYNIDCP